MGESKYKNKTLTIINKTGKTMRDMEISIGDEDTLDILKIKNDYEKTIFLSSSSIGDLVDLRMKYNGAEYLMYKNLDISNEVSIKVEFTLNDDESLKMKSFLFI